MKDLFVKKKQEVEATKAYRGNFRLDKLDTTDRTAAKLSRLKRFYFDSNFDLQSQTFTL